mmetsp:Transcript_25681/g.37834  ORF Transcript_25681/g.37834 Transcript_25681/m.37834 type:complete len:289 (+) Transcript_25681:48-914(+)
MKFYGNLLALCSLNANVWGTTAFSVQAPKASSSVVLKSSNPSDLDLFPEGTFPSTETIQGGGTVRTYKLPPWATRVQYTLKTNGRPLKAKVGLWLGPIRQVHTMEIDSQDGSKTPYSATLKFKKLAPMLKITTSDNLELPVLAAVSVPSPERAIELKDNTERLWGMATPEQKQLVQGGSTSGGGGSIRFWNIPDNVESVQVISWSFDVGKKSFKCQIEAIQGQNNPKQDFFLQCGGGSQPYHAVIQTPGPGWMIRLKNKKFVEDGLFQFAVIPYQVSSTDYTQPRTWP